MPTHPFLMALLDGARVEWHPLGSAQFFEIANAQRKPIKASLRSPGKTPYYGANNIQDYVSGHTHEGEYTLIAEDGTQSIQRYSIQYATGRFWANNHIHVLRGNSNINTRYLYHSLGTINFIPYLTGGDRPKLTKTALEKISIPIPCPEDPEKSLAIQSEIVRILDAFLTLTNELTNELTLREQQYNHYRDELLDFSKRSDVEWKTLGEVFEIFAGGDVPKDALSDIQTDEYSIPILSNGIGEKSIYGWTNQSRISRPSLTVSARGTIGWTSYRETPFFPIVRLLALTPKTQMNLKYAYYFMKMIENDYKVAKSGIPQLTKPMIQSVKIPLPPLAEQARIAAILDTFDTLTRSVTAGLPQEIALRQRQYEYYRDLLFRFPKPDAA